MFDLADTYAQLARPWTAEELAARYRSATSRGEELVSGRPNDAASGSISLLATAVPPASDLALAIHLLHALPDGSQDRPVDSILDSAETNVADALYRSHRALELDSAGHDYSVDEWLPVISDIAAALLESVSLDEDPPSIVRQTQDAIQWLARSIAELDQDSPDATAALTDTLGRLLTVSMFTDVARRCATR